jgi:hypothetical protein
MKVKKLMSFFKPYGKPIAKEKEPVVQLLFTIVYASVLLLAGCPPAAPASS